MIFTSMVLAVAILAINGVLRDHNQPNCQESSLTLRVCEVFLDFATLTFMAMGIFLALNLVWVDSIR